MLRHRRNIMRILRGVGPGLLLVVTVCAAGLGFHAAGDWHRHGEVSAGFFHLHFHVGDHEHPNIEAGRVARDSGHDAHHDHGEHRQPAHDDGDDPPAPFHPDHEQSTSKSHAVLTIPHAVKQVGHDPPLVAAATPAAQITTPKIEVLPGVSWRPGTSEPRGPPS